MSDDNCGCGSIGNTGGVRFCQPCHRYWRNDKELVSVGKILRTTWPIKPGFSAADPGVLENARVRGAAVDFLFSKWLVGELDAFPVGTREDAILGFNAVREWWELEDRGDVQTQVILADDEIAGTADIVTSHGMLWDLKCVLKVEATYELQLGGYLDLGGDYRGCGLIHCAFSKGGTVATVKPVIFEAQKALSEWRVLRQMYRMVQRKTGGVKP